MQGTPTCLHVYRGDQLQQHFRDQLQHHHHLKDRLPHRFESADLASSKKVRLQFRDEMEKATAEPTAASASGGLAKDGMDDESAQLAEGFVRTSNLLPVPVDLVDPAASPLEQPQPQYPQPPTLQPTRTVPLPQPPQDNVGAVYQNQAQLRQQSAVDAGVPIWIDRLIVLLGVLLAAMVTGHGCKSLP
jgi:ubiquitin-conjugating enzyme E2 J1